MNTQIKATLAVTMGDAAGVGPELCLRLIERALEPNASFRPVIVGDAGILRRVSESIGVPISAPVLSASEVGFGSDNELPREGFVADLGLLAGESVSPGKIQAACGRAAVEYIRYAVRSVQNGFADAVVTAPLNKESLHLGGFSYPGHTEMLADLTGCLGKEAMLFYCEKVAVTFATLHTSLSNACRTLRIEDIASAGHLAATTVSRLRDRPVRLGVLGLNPHAGEGGLFGNKEREVISPAIERLRADGIDASGPLVPDAAFLPQNIDAYDCFVTMYHDQGAVPFKMLAFDEGVNVTMGLPIVRTSPDHGTAFDIAWKGEASASSFFAAADLAVRLVGGKLTRPPGAASGSHQ